MQKSALTRRAVLATLALGAPAAALAAPGSGRILVDVSQLRRDGDNTDADYLAEVLPGYLRETFGPGHTVVARIDSVTYGTPGSGGGHENGAVDSMEGVGVIDGRTIPLLCNVVIANVALPDIGGYGAHLRQDQLARSFAYWLPRQSGY